MTPLFLDKEKLIKLKGTMLKWVGTPYNHLQVEIGKGADCGLFIAKCLYDIGIIHSMNFWNYHPRFWQNITDKELIIEYVEKVADSFTKSKYCMKEVSTAVLLAGDIITFALRSKRTNHIGVYFGNNFMMHSLNNRGVCVVDLSSIYKNRLTKVYRIYGN